MALNQTPKIPEKLEELVPQLRRILRTHAEAINVAWDDLTFPASAINPAGSPAPATIDNVTYPGTLLFTTTTDSHIAGVAQMPHAWKEGTSLYPHIHWTKTVADGSGLSIGWQFRSAVVSIGAVIGAMSAWDNGTLAYGDLTTAEKHNITSFTPVSMTGKTVSTMVIWELRRNVALDTYASDTRLLAIDFHYQVDSFGSDTEYTK